MHGKVSKSGFDLNQVSNARDATWSGVPLSMQVSTRMRMLKVKGRSIALKVLRAVKNAPELARKGSVGHGICDHYTRTVTLPTFTDDPAVITREACAILRDLQACAQTALPPSTPVGSFSAAGQIARLHLGKPLPTSEF